MRSYKNPQACRNITHIRIRTHTYTHSDLRLSASVWLCSFFPAVVSTPPPPGLEESAAPGDGRLRWLTAGSLEVEEPLKHSLPLSLSSRDLQHSHPEQLASLSFANTPRKKLTHHSQSKHGFFFSMKWNIKLTQAVFVLWWGNNEEHTGNKYF